MGKTTGSKSTWALPWLRTAFSGGARRTGGKAIRYSARLNCTLDVWCLSHEIPEACYITITTKNKTQLHPFPYTAEKSSTPGWKSQCSLFSKTETYFKAFGQVVVHKAGMPSYCVVTKQPLDSSCPEASGPLHWLPSVSVHVHVHDEAGAFGLFFHEGSPNARAVGGEHGFIPHCVYSSLQWRVCRNGSSHRGGHKKCCSEKWITFLFLYSDFPVLPTIFGLSKCYW